VDTPLLEEFRRQLAADGWRVLSADEGYGFGSWSIELEWGLRVVYNGRDEQLEIYREELRDRWVNVWKATDENDQTPAAVLDALRSFAERWE
jgi:hypothetical protein